MCGTRITFHDMQDWTKKQEKSNFHGAGEPFLFFLQPSFMDHHHYSLYAAVK